MLVDQLYVATISENGPAARVLEKCGFLKNTETVTAFQILVDPEDDAVYGNVIAEYVLGKEF
ncbi:MAG: hypothetical protein K1W10_13100 [Lachnospiraceae bacterium]